MQSKDLMFSISKNPHASRAEVLAKTEKYINSEEALLSKQRSSSTQKEKGRSEKKKDNEAPREGRTRTNPQGVEKIESGT